MPDNRYQLHVDVSIRDNYGGGLRISEDTDIGDLGFDDMAALLKGFHELALSIAAVARES